MALSKNKAKKVIGITAVAALGLSAIAVRKKAESTYSKEPEEKNTLEGKHVVFVEDEKDALNADGVRGHLEVAGEDSYKESYYEKYVKRGFDIALSFGGLVVLAPVFGAIALAIKIDDPGPVMFTQKRLGKNKEYFKLHKFRSMKMSTPHDTPTHMLDNPEQYITRVGRFLREHSLDELPQIWDIFIGNMSIVGPRPGLWNQDVLTAERDKYNANGVRPGLTGLAQINGRDELEIPLKAKLDGKYVSEIGLDTDVKCLLGTVSSVLTKDGVVEGFDSRFDESEFINTEIPEGIRVSVIMPTYRRGSELRRALESLKAQTYENFEVVIVDDNAYEGWNQQVADIVEGFINELDMTLVVNDTNLGSAKSRNSGIEAARGEYITFLDDDDEYLPEKIENQLKSMIANDADYGITNLYLYTEKGNLADRRVRSYIKSTDKEDLIRYHMLYHMTGTDTLMFRTDYINQIGRFREIDLGDEFYLMCRAIEGNGKFAYANNCYVKAYVHSGESSGLSTGDGKIEGEYRLFEEKMKNIDHLSKDDIKYIKMRHYAVIAYAELKHKRIKAGIINGVKSFASSPKDCVGLLIKGA